MIEDRELRDLFKIESEEHIQRLDDGLLRLENIPDDAPLIEAMFREAHSLKGASRMLGLNRIETLAHQLEDALGAAHRGEAKLTPEMAQSLFKMLDTLRQLAQEALGQEPGRTTEESLLSQNPEPPVAALPPLAASVVQAQRQPEAPISAVTTPETGARAEVFQIDTIRVDPQRLDLLLTQAGELTVTKIRIARHLTELDEALDYCYERNRSNSSRRSADMDKPEGQRLEHLQSLLTRLHDGLAKNVDRLDFVSDQIENAIRALRLIPFSTLFRLFPRMVHDLSRDQHKEIELHIEGEELVADKRILEEMKDPLMHMLRNAIDHGIETPEQRERSGKPRTGAIRLGARQTANGIEIEVSDDGGGLDLEVIKNTAVKRGLCREDEFSAMSDAQIQALILTSGFSTSTFVTDVSGRGVGLDVVRSNVERLKGTIRIESTPGHGMRVCAQLPVTLATARVLIIAAAGHRYALPVEYVRFSRNIHPEALYSLEGRKTLSFDGQPVSVAKLQDLLEMVAPASLAKSRAQPSVLPCIVLAVGEEIFGVMVDELLDELEVVLKPQSKLLKRVRNISGATILETGEVCMVLNPPDLLKSMRRTFVAASAIVPAEAPATKKGILLVEDSIITRTQEKRILEAGGYEVVTAVDGVDAFNKLASRHFDAVVSDIMMPNMGGLELTEKIRASGKFAELPIILVTSLASDEDKRRGLVAGANAYLTKPEFDQRVLLETLQRLI